MFISPLYTSTIIQTILTNIIQQVLTSLLPPPHCKPFLNAVVIFQNFSSVLVGFLKCQTVYRWLSESFFTPVWKARSRLHDL